MADEFGAIDDEDFGAIDDEDLGAIPDPAVPEINVYELNRKAEEQNKALQEQAQAQAIQAQAAAAADPKNWTLQQTQDHFKNNPPQTIQDEAFSKQLIDTKKKAIKEVQEKIDGTYKPEPPVIQPSANPEEWTYEQTKENFKLNPPRTVAEEATQKVFLEKKKKEFKKEGLSAVAGFVRSFMRNSPLEQYATDLYLLKNKDKIPEPIEGETWEQYGQRFVKETGYKEREDEIIKKGTIAQLEAPMTLAMGASGMSAPAYTAKLLAKFLAIDKVAEFAGIHDLIKKVPNPTAKDVIDIALFGVEGVLSGGSWRGAVKDFNTWRKNRGIKEKSKLEIKAEEAKGKPAEEAKPVEEVAPSAPEPAKLEAPSQSELPPVKDFKLPSFGTEPLPGPEGKWNHRVVKELTKVNKNRELTPTEQAAQNWVVENPVEAKQRYIERSIEEFGSNNVISADVGKFAIPGMKASNSRNYHEAGSALAKARTEELLVSESTKDLPAAFLAGGSGSGKSSLLRAATKKEGVSVQDKYALVHDTNLNSYNSAITKIKDVLNTGRPVEINYVYRDPILAWENGVIPRVKHQDRIVPIKDHIDTHRGSLPVVRQLFDQYNTDQRFKFLFKDNSFEHGKPRKLSSLDEVPKFDYTNIEDKLYVITKQAYIDGKINRAQFETALEGSPELQARAVSEIPGLIRPSGPSVRGVAPEGAPASGLKEVPATKIESTQNFEIVDPIVSQEPLAPERVSYLEGQVKTPGKRRKFIDTVKKSDKTAPEVAGEIESRYSPISNKETLARAQEAVARDYNAAVDLVTGPARPTADSNAQAIVLIDKAQAEGRYADAINLVERTAEKQTALGQAIQSLSMYNRLTPEGILMYAQKVVKNARENVKQKGRIDQFEKLRKGLNEQDTGKLADRLGVPHISETVAKELRGMAEQIKAGKFKEIFDKEISDSLLGRSVKQTLEDAPVERQNAVATALLLNKIGKLVPRSLGQKASIVQTIAQLLNPKTFIRNLLGNVGFQITEGFTDYVATALDVAVALKTGKRTVYPPDVKTQAQGLVQGFKEGVQEATVGVNLKEDTTKFTLPKNGVFDKGVMGALEKTLRISLGATDRAFYQAAFNQSIRDQVRAFKAEGKDITEPTPEMIERAHALGLYRTFQDENVISNQFVKLKKWLNLNKSFGLGDVILKYPKTPANLLARGIEYSPFGLIKSTYELVKPLLGQGDFNQEAFVRSTSRALTGTATQVATGALLAGLGIISGKRSDDKDVTATKENVGLRAYQLNISALKRFFMSGFDPEAAVLREDDLLINYDWLLPTSIGLALGANMVIDPKSNLVDRTLNMADKLAQASETLQEQPLVQGVARFAQNRNVAESFTDAFQSIPASFVPTLLNQVRQLMDNTARNTKDLNWLKEMKNKAVMRIPGLSGTLPPRVTTLGQDKEMYQFDSNNPFNVFLNPAFVTKYKPDPVSRMVLEIWENSGETIQFPRVAQGKIKLGGDMPQPLELTAEQYTEFQRYIGNKTDVLFTMLSDNPEFLAQSDEDKAKQLQGFLTDINTAAKIEVLGYEPKRVSEDVLSIIQDIARDKKIIDDADDDDDLGAVDEEP